MLDFLYLKNEDDEFNKLVRNASSYEIQSIREILRNITKLETLGIEKDVAEKIFLERSLEILSKKIKRMF